MDRHENARPHWRAVPGAKDISHKSRVNDTSAVTPAQAFLPRLQSLRPAGPGRWRSTCPSCSGNPTALSVRECQDGALLITCFKGCSAQDIVQAVGLSMADLFPPNPVDHYADSPRVPPFDWQGFKSASRSALTVICIALKDIAAGKPVSESDSDFLVSTAERLLATLDISEVRR